MRGSGTAITAVRQAKGWTQGDLAGKLGVSQGFISKVENDQLDLDGGQLEELALLLNVPSELLALRDPYLGAPATCVHHRRRKSRLTALSARRIEGLTQLISISVTGLTPAPAWARLAPLAGLAEGHVTPNEAARSLRHHIDVGDDPIPNIVKVVEDLDVAVVIRDFGTDAQDASSLDAPGRRPTVVVNTALSGDRQRFSVAHELGHLVLHAAHVPTDVNAIEQEANQFAAALLLPDARLRRELSGLTARDFARLLTLKQHWGMSMAALIEHARRFDVIDDRLHRTLRIKLHDLGWAKVEPGSVENEEPMLVRRTIDDDLDTRGRTIEELAAAAFMCSGSFVRHFLSHRSAEVSTLEGNNRP